VHSGDDLRRAPAPRRVGEAEHDTHVVLDDEQRAALRDAADEGDDRRLGLGAAHARRGSSSRITSAPPAIVTPSSSSAALLGVRVDTHAGGP
jgi:hypothetical protein